MTQTLQDATRFIEQGRLVHLYLSIFVLTNSLSFFVPSFLDIRVGLDVVRDPGFLVTRQMEDHITWSDKSVIKEKVQTFNETKDDYDLLGE